jgi:hypothetical protein
MKDEKGKETLYLKKNGKRKLNVELKSKQVEQFW